MLLAFLAILFSLIAAPVGAGIASLSLRALIVGSSPSVIVSPLATAASVALLWLGLRAGVGPAPRLLELAGLSHVPMLVVGIAGLVLNSTLGLAVAAGMSAELFASAATDFISLGYWVAIPASVALVYVALRSLCPAQSTPGALGFFGGQVALHLLVYFGATCWSAA